VLLKPTHACPVYCRFCFRREAGGPGGESLSPAALDRALAAIARDERIWEVILSGGDPLILSPRRLAEIVARIDEIPHLGVFRVQTRVPAVERERVTPALAGGAPRAQGRLGGAAPNHARELDLPRAQARARGSSTRACRCSRRRSCSRA
jgi:lysine 2,3-aminomutase